MLIRPRYTGPKFVTPSPIMNLAFAADKALDSRVTFTRASSGTYFDASGVLQTASSNVPRFTHDPSTLQSLGLLIEESRTNLLTYSEEFDNGAWSKFNSTISANATTAPDGTATADKVVGDTSATQVDVRQSPSLTATNTYSLSVFLKAAEHSLVRVGGFPFGSGAPSAKFDLSDGSIVSTGGLTATIEACDNDWYLVTVSGGSFSAGPSFMFVGTEDYTGDGSSGFYIWGAQLEQGSFPTSYIKTTASTVTRAADSASMTGTNFSSWYNQVEGVFVVDCGGAQGVFPEVLEIYLDGNNYIKLGKEISASTPSTQITATSLIANAGQFSIGTGDGSGKFSMALATNDSAVSANGSAAVEDNSCVFADFTDLVIGYSIANGNARHCNTTIAQISYYPKRLSNAWLQALTS